MPRGHRVPTGDASRARRVLVVVLALLCVVVAATAGPWQPEQRATAPLDLPLPPPPAAEPAPEPEREPLEVGPPDPDLAWIGRTLWLVAIAVALALLVRWALRRQVAGRTPPPPATEASGLDPLASVTEAAPDARTLREGALRAVEHLAARVPPRDAVIAAWVALEDAAARSGMRRAPAATPTEFTLDVLDRTRADPAAGRTLLELYLRARFGDAPLGDDDVVAAARAAGVLVATLGAGATSPTQTAAPPDAGHPAPPASAPGASAPGPPGRGGSR